MEIENIKKEVKKDYNLVKRLIQKAYHFVYEAILKYLRDDITVKAAGLAFYQLLTIIPLMMLVFYVLGRILGNKLVFERVLKSFTYFHPEIQQIVSRNILRIRETGILTALFGFFLFLFLTRKYLRELLFAVRKIIGENSYRPKTIKGNIFRFLRNVLHQLMYIIVYVLLITLGASFSSIAFNYFGVLENLIGSVPGVIKYLISLLILSIPLIAYTAFYYFIYWHTPDYMPPKKYALIGAIFTTVSNQLLFFLYKLYVEKFLYASNIYGTLSTVAALVIWYYLSSIVVLFGAVIVYMLNRKQKCEYHI
jgi:membrane protein